MRPNLGVFPFVFKARNRAFSAPSIWTVDAVEGVSISRSSRYIDLTWIL